MQLAILGRQNKLGLAEIESVIGAPNLQPLGNIAAVIKQPIDPARFGGIVRLAEPLAEAPLPNWQATTKALSQQFLALLPQLPDGKVKLGISVFGMQAVPRDLLAAGLALKKAARAAGRSVRIVPGNGLELNSAQVLHNKLTGGLGIELLAIKNGVGGWVARTTWTQDVDAYAKRDFGRPKRDAFVGMLPPKLAQTMLNLAQVKAGQHLLDPFCGTGVVLQEAALMGAVPYGTDISEKMVDYSRHNLEWLHKTYGLGTSLPAIGPGDATNHRWQPPIDHVVCETYLGQPLSGLPRPEKLAEIRQNCDTIITKFLQNLHGQLKPGTRCAIAVPAWKTANQFIQLPLLDRLEDLGYNRVKFTHASWDSLRYYRPGQIVARELLVIISK